MNIRGAECSVAKSATWESSRGKQAAEEAEVRSRGALEALDLLP